MTNTDLYNALFKDEKSIGKNLRNAREGKKKITRQKAAEDAALSIDTIKNIEKGQKCRLESVAQYAASLDLNPCEVIFNSAYLTSVSTMESQVNTFLHSLSEQQLQTLDTIISSILNFPLHSK